MRLPVGKGPDNGSIVNCNVMNVKEKSSGDPKNLQKFQPDKVRQGKKAGPTALPLPIADQPPEIVSRRYDLNQLYIDRFSLEFFDEHQAGSVGVELVLNVAPL